ncbi:6-carboxytetrahydropterin synthase QueD [Bradyrhizobium sp. F1.13.3]|uniref:6-carboxytetrahydropterin synthase QueD n=1 Tax=Bradyrhizobium sp. F1.13.3 TaxID=3156351 RepID=UPI003399FB3D
MTTHVKPPPLESRTRASPEQKSRASKLVTRIGRTYRFESAHHLPLLPDGHKCKNVHGHNYRVEVVISGALDTRGFVMDFAEMDAEILPLIRRVDHRLLNEVEGLENPTAEVIATWFFQRITGCESVRVYENDDCWAEVRIS